MMIKYEYFKTILVLAAVTGTYCSNFTVTVLDGEDATLPCILPPQLAENNTVYWSNKEDLISEGDNITVSGKWDRFSLYRPYNSDWYLRILPTKLADEGVYTCHIGKGIFSSAAQLIVESPPYIIGYDSDKLYLQVCNTARVTLYCNVTGRPQPTIKWYKRIAGDKLKYLELNTESIFIPEVHHSNTGVFLCQVSNTHGKASMEFHITVVDLVTVLNRVEASQAPRQSGLTPSTASSAVNTVGNMSYSFLISFLFIAVFH